MYHCLKRNLFLRRVLKACSKGQAFFLTEAAVPPLLPKKNGKKKILPQSPSLADLTESRPVSSNIARVCFFVIKVAL